MQFKLPSLLESFRYSPLSHESTDASSTKRLYMKVPWKSKTARLALLVCVVLILLATAVVYRDRIQLPDHPAFGGASTSYSTPPSSSTKPPSLSPPPSSPKPSSASSSSHLVTTNAEVLEAVADSIDWSRFAYVQYVTNQAYLCNSLMLFASLSQLGCRSERLMMHPQEWSPDVAAGQEMSTETRLLRLARDTYGVHLQPIHVESRSGGDSTWAESYTKLLAMNQTHYNRVLSLDSDSTILQCLDELFLLPPAPVAMPRAYWHFQDKWELSSQLLLVEPNEEEFARIMRVVSTAPTNKYDMDILNDMYNKSAIVLPHREYDLLTGEFKSRDDKKDHSLFLGNDEEKWDPVKIRKQAKFIHFSDWPIAKPWILTPQGTLDREGPICHNGDCADHDIWYEFYSDFRMRRKEVCDFDVK